MWQKCGVDREEDLNFQKYLPGLDDETRAYVETVHDDCGVCPGCGSKLNMCACDEPCPFCGHKECYD